MKAYQKFEKRLRELGLFEDWHKQGAIGRVGTETEDAIIILVHESEVDKYTEFTYPTMKELGTSNEFRLRALKEFVSWDDDEFRRKLCYWVVDPSNECPLFPVDVFFLYDGCSFEHFEDDTEETLEDVLKHYEKTEEWCPHCDECVELEHDLKVQKCPVCGKWIVPCSVCPLTDCSTKCPLERLAIILNKE